MFTLDAKYVCYMEINEITHKIIGCSMQVHNTLGNGFQEVIYQRALAIEINLDVHKAQAINYLEAYNMADGLLVNFGGLSLDFKRLYNKRLVKPSSENSKK